jgi:hypothetical protein
MPNSLTGDRVMECKNCYDRNSVGSNAYLMDRLCEKTEEVNKLLDDNRRLLAMLKRIQQEECPICGTDDEYGHEVDCELASILMEMSDEQAH